MAEDDELIEVYNCSNQCPVEGCGFMFQAQHCRSEEEARALLMLIVRLHGRQRHGSKTYFDPDISVVDTTKIHKLAERPELVN